MTKQQRGERRSRGSGRTRRCATQPSGGLVRDLVPSPERRLGRQLGMHFVGVPLPQVLVDLIADKTIVDTVNWPIWVEQYNTVKLAMRKELCSCGSQKEKIDPWHNPACCVEQNKAEFEARIGERPEASVERRARRASTLDSVCHGTRVDARCWLTLLKHYIDYSTRYEYDASNLRRGVCSIATALPVLGLTAKQVLAKFTRLRPTDQQLVDVHRAILLNDAEAFLAVVRVQPRFLLADQPTGGTSARRLGLREHKRTELQVDPRVAGKIDWMQQGCYARIGHTLHHMLNKVQPPTIIQLIGLPVMDSGYEDSDDEVFIPRGGIPRSTLW